MGIVLFFFFLFPPLCAAQNCPISFCGNRSIPVRFPFSLQGNQLENCGYPGFELGCNSQGTTVLNLPYSGEFLVRNINYFTQEINLYDPGKCLPKRLLSFNLSGSPFSASYYQNYTFLSCPTQAVISRFTTIGCLSNSTNSVLATSSMNLVKSMPPSCHIIVTLPVPVSFWFAYNEEFSSALDQDIQLTWYTPDCGGCEAIGGVCGFKNNSNQAIGCFFNRSSGRSSSNIGYQVFRIGCLTFAILGASFAVGMIVIASSARRSHRLGAHSTQGNSNLSTVAERSTTTAVGMDDSTIESYQKVVLGESQGLPGPNGSTCSICLSEYQSKETLRCIPKCQHCFHAGCIDEWLRLNSTCPLCRNSPSPALVSLQIV
ncbi:hypothetical protein SLE2022_029900 [Rubroshorea leprosula]